MSAFEQAQRALEDAIVSEVHNRLLANWRRVDRPAHAVAIVQQVVREVLRTDDPALAPRVLCLVSLEGGGVRLRARVRATARILGGKSAKVIPIRKEVYGTKK